MSTSNKPLTFGVGPSKLFPGLDQDICEIAKSGILEKSHRSPEFSELSQNSMTLLRNYLKVPEDYYVFYTASATEAMEITLRSAISKKSTHCTNGSFSSKWAKMAQELGFETEVHENAMGTRIELDEIKVAEDSEALFITANETSTGAMFYPEEISQINQEHPEKLLCIDATSCAAAMNYDLSQVDAFLYSVQKCPGMPSGLGILVVSPRLFAKAKEKKVKGGDIGTFHSLLAMDKKMQGKFQTSETPSIMQIALLGKSVERIQKQIGNLEAAEKYTLEKIKMVYDFFANHPDFECFVQNPAHRSATVAVIKGSEEKIAEAKAKCVNARINLQNGYGPAKSYTFRLGNFLAHSKEDFERLFGVLG
jgi:phosphoserine aminotransferase